MKLNFWRLRQLESGESVVAATEEDAERLVGRGGTKPVEPRGVPCAIVDSVLAEWTPRPSGAEDAIRARINGLLMRDYGVRDTAYHLAEGEAVWPRRTSLWLREHQGRFVGGDVAVFPREGMSVMDQLVQGLGARVHDRCDGYAEGYLLEIPERRMSILE